MAYEDRPQYDINAGAAYGADRRTDIGLDSNNGSTDYYGAGLQTLGLIGDLWSGYQQVKVQREQNKLARESFEFNKDLSMKNFNLAKEDHDRRVRKNNSVTRQYANSSKKWANKRQNSQASRQSSVQPSIASEESRRQRIDSRGV